MNCNEASSVCSAVVQFISFPLSFSLSLPLSLSVCLSLLYSTLLPMNSDVDGSGVMNSTKLREVFVAFGLGELSDSEIDLLMRATDLDGDGVINLGTATLCYAT